MADAAGSTNKTTNQVSAVSQLVDIYNLFKGKGGGTTTQTTSNNITPEGVQAIIQDMLQGSGGLASIGTATKGAGLYNSSTNKLLAGNLMAKAAGEAAKASASTTTTSTAPSQKGLGSKGALGLMLLNQIAGSKAGKKLADSGTDNLVDRISSMFSSGGDSVSAGSTSVMGTDGPMSTSSFANDGSLFNLDGVGSLFDYSYDDGGLSDAVSTSSLFDFGSSLGDLTDAGSTYIPAAADAAIDWGSDATDLLFAEGGRVPGSIYTAAPTNILKYSPLGKYSRAVQADASGAGIGAADSTDSAENAEPPTLESGAKGLGDWAVEGYSDARGISYQQGAEELQSLGKGAVTVGTMIGGGGIGAFAGRTASELGAGKVVSQIAAQLGSRGQRSIVGEIMSSIFDPVSALNNKTDWSGREDVANEGRTANNMDAFDYNNIAALGARAGLDENVLAEAVARGDFGNLSMTGEQVTAQDSSSGDDSYSGGIDGSVGDFGSSVSDSVGGPDSGTSFAAKGGRIRKAYATGGRVHGDKQYGVDDVPIQIKGVGKGALDGGEFVINAMSTAEIDRQLGPQFLEMLNKLGKGAR